MKESEKFYKRKQEFAIYFRPRTLREQLKTIVSQEGNY